MNRVAQLPGFLLTRQCYDRPVRRKHAFPAQNQSQAALNQTETEYWVWTEEGPFRLLWENYPASFFFPESDHTRALALFRQYQLHGRLRKCALSTFDGRPVYQSLFSTQADARQAVTILHLHKIPTYENDLRLSEQLLMQQQITAGLEFSGSVIQRPGYREVRVEHWAPAEVTPAFTVLSLDVECAPDGRLYSVAGVCRFGDGHEEAKAICVGPAPDLPVQASETDSIALTHWVDNESALLVALGDWFSGWDPDVVIGWNVINFDFKLLQTRAELYHLPLKWGRGGRLCRWRASGGDELNGLVSMPGRVVIDGIDALKTSTYRLERYNLEFVARHFLGEGKAIAEPEDRLQEITRLFLEDKPALIHYNLQDCRLVLGIFDDCHLLPFLVLRSQLTGLELGRYGGSVAAFSHLYIPRLHQAGYVAPNLPVGAIATSPGGYVMNSRPGFYRNVLVLDFKSLYPSIIRTFHIDPLALVKGLQEEDAIPGFVGGQFSRHHAILPGLIDHLWAARDQAKRDRDAARSQAIKILMNAFYGVLGSTGCRFFDTRLASSITMRGHAIMQQTRTLIEAEGYQVIYGDTDSTFVWIEAEVTPTEAAEIGSRLVAHINTWWQSELQRQFQLPSFLEIQFERHFVRFLMPTLRGAEEGSKKRYAGQCLIDGKPQMIYKGLETVRSDWTPLAKAFQQELYQLVFAETDPSPLIERYLDDTRQGKLDSLLVYRKRIRRDLASYDKVSPPHVKAARLANACREQDGLPPLVNRKGWIDYVMTVQGPEPVAYQRHPLDYQHYIDKQLRPVADAILPYVHLSFDQFEKNQLSLF